MNNISPSRVPTLDNEQAMQGYLLELIDQDTCNKDQHDIDVLKFKEAGEKSQ